MKKILLATTLLAGTAGYATAAVTISGSARMGVVQQVVGAVAAGFTTTTDPLTGLPIVTANVVSAGTVKAVLTSRVQIAFAATGTTDGGLAFGASVRADQNGGNTDGTKNVDSTVFISGAFGKLTMGNVEAGAADELVGQISGVGFTGLTGNSIDFLGGTATAALYDYTSGPFSVALGVSQPTAVAGSDKKSIAVKYAAAKYNVALGYETVTGNNQISLKAGMTFGAATLTVKAAKTALTGMTDTGLSLDYAVNPALKVTAFYTTHNAVAGTNAMGLGASYDLGGGASVVGGVVNNGTTTLADLGVNMTF